MAFDIQALQEGGNLRSSAVHHDEVSALADEAGHVAGKGPAEFRHCHGVSAVFDDYRQ